LPRAHFARHLNSGHAEGILPPPHFGVVSARSFPDSREVLLVQIQNKPTAIYKVCIHLSCFLEERRRAICYLPVATNTPGSLLARGPGASRHRGKDRLTTNPLQTLFSTESLSQIAVVSKRHLPVAVQPKARSICFKKYRLEDRRSNTKVSHGQRNQNLPVRWAKGEGAFAPLTYTITATDAQHQQ